MERRGADLDRLYELLAGLQQRLGGRPRLADCHGRMKWPKRGVYFFFEPGELRADGVTPRVVRVGTHALRPSKNTLWGRLSQHRGHWSTGVPGGGNHRGSIFRRHVGAALLAQGAGGDAGQTWSLPSPVTAAMRATERELEIAVTRRIGAMSVLWVPIDDEAGPNSARGVIEAGAIALLTNRNRSPFDAASPTWLGRHADRADIRDSGLWNVDHVSASSYDPVFLDLLATFSSSL
jgi:hypothetical protein